MDDYDLAIGRGPEISADKTDETAPTSLPLGQTNGLSKFLYRRLYRWLSSGKRRHRSCDALARLFPTVLTGDLENTFLKVRKAAEAVYGNDWNSFSDALRPEVIDCFNRSIQHLSSEYRLIDYLEIGSAQGLSMSLIGTDLRQIDRLGALVSIDPYLEEGYSEADVHVQINKSTEDKAKNLYSSLDLPVSVMQQTSDKALSKLLRNDRKFHLIYIDGYHSGLTPTLDFGLSWHLLHDRGIIMIDDHVWPDVTGLKELCDHYYEKICECWKIACYRIVRS